MIRTNTFRIYNTKTYEKIDKLETDYNNDFFDDNDDNFLSFDEKNIIICGSYDVYTYNGYSLTVFEGDIVKVVTRDCVNGEYTEYTYEGLSSL